MADLRIEDLAKHQEAYAEIASKNDKCMIVAPTSAGKTAAALLHVSKMIKSSKVNRVLLIAPSRVANSVWPKEVESCDFCKGITIDAISGAPSKRLFLLKKFKSSYSYS